MSDRRLFFDVHKIGRYDFQIGWAKPTFGQTFGWAGLVFFAVLLSDY